MRPRRRREAFRVLHPFAERSLVSGREAGDDGAMAKSGGGPRFFRRRGDELTVKDGEGHKHQATLERVDADTTQEDGSFVLGYCKSCDWTGPARRARDKARKDALAHADECPSKGKVRLGVSEEDPR
jgi:hypothetical protein